MQVSFGGTIRLSIHNNVEIANEQLKARTSMLLDLSDAFDTVDH